MYRKITLCLLSACFLYPVLAQTKLPVIRATSTKVSIQDDNFLNKDSWTIVPELKPDVYYTSAKKVTFYTDLESISFTIKPGKTYDFYILLNDKDSALTQIQYKKSHLDILKSAKNYNFSDNRPVPEFTYQSPDNENLRRIRQELRLDSIAGKGNEISQMINLLHWVHNTVRHDGSSNNPKEKNAIDLIKICQAEKRGINCRMMAITLNECYLAMGFPSRFITCMPKDSVFDDCHVINMVYSNDMQKWLWMDPTFDAYVMNEKGELLSIQEVRERLINGKPLIVNPDANWNHETSTVKEDYLYRYMAKNLYRIEAHASSEYNIETYQKGKTWEYIELLPLDAYKQQKEESRHEGAVYMTQLKTNNPNIFWAKPQPLVN